MASFTLHNQDVSWDYSYTNSEVAFRLYVNGDLRDRSGWIKLSGDWVPVARAGVNNHDGTRRELKMIARRRFFSLSRFEYRFVYEDKVYKEGAVPH